MNQQPDDTGSGAPAGAGRTQQGCPRPGGAGAADSATAPERAQDEGQRRPREEKAAEAAKDSAAAGVQACASDPEGPEPQADVAAAQAGDDIPSDPADAADAAGAAAQARISELEDQIGQLGDDLAQARADHYNLKREYSGFVRRQKDEGARSRELGRRDVLSALLSVLDDIDAARQHDDLAGPFKAVAEKLEGALEKGFDLHRYGEAGDEFDPALHDALLAQDSSEVQVATVAQVIQPGYRSGDTVLRPTKVMVNNPA